jgi:hypothetical protein
MAGLGKVLCVDPAAAYITGQVIHSDGGMAMEWVRQTVQNESKSMMVIPCQFVVRTDMQGILLHTRPLVPQPIPRRPTDLLHRGLLG